MLLNACYAFVDTSLKKTVKFRLPEMGLNYDVNERHFLQGLSGLTTGCNNTAVGHEASCAGSVFPTKDSNSCIMFLFRNLVRRIRGPRK